MQISTSNACFVFANNKTKNLVSPEMGDQRTKLCCSNAGGAVDAVRPRTLPAQQRSSTAPSTAASGDRASTGDRGTRCVLGALSQQSAMSRSKIYGALSFMVVLHDGSGFLGPALRATTSDLSLLSRSEAGLRRTGCVKRTSSSNLGIAPSRSSLSRSERGMGAVR